MQTGTVRLGALVLAVVVALLYSSCAISQEGTPEAGEIPMSDQLYSAEPVMVPTEANLVAISRLTFAPGSTKSWEPVRGPSLHYIDAGTVAVQMENLSTSSAFITRTTPGTPVSVPSGERVDIGPGELLVGPPDSLLEMSNVGNEPAITLAVEFLPEDTVSTSVEGVDDKRLVSAPVDFHDAPIAVELTRLTLPPFAIASSRQVAGSEFVIVDAGECAMALHPGQALIKRGYGGEQSVIGGEFDPLATFEPDPEPDPDPEADEGATGIPTPGPPVLQGTVVGLNEGDVAIVAAGGTYSLQGGSDEPAILLMLAITPVNESTGIRSQTGQVFSGDISPLKIG